MALPRLVGGFCVLALLAAGATGRASDGSPPEPAAEGDAIAAPATAGDISLWIKSLDANRFADREEASRHLVEAGQAALPALAEAAGSPTLEVSQRALDVFKQHLQSEDAALKHAAKEQLEHLAKSSNGTLARRAQTVLQPPERLAAGSPIGGIQVFPGGPIQLQGRIQVNGAIQIAGGGAVKVVQIQNNNNNGAVTKHIEVQENGKKVVIDEDPQNGIKIKCTENVNGTEKVSEYQAKSLDDLKKNHPEGAKIYEKCGGGGANIQIQVQPAIQLVPAQIVPVPAQPDKPAEAPAEKPK